MRRFHLSVCALLFSAAPGFAVTLEAVDGSTFSYNGETFSIANIYTPDMTNGKCDAERRLGKVAKARLDVLLLSGRINIQRGDTLGGPDKDDQGRSLGTVVINGKDIGSMMIGEYLARPRKDKAASWCQD